MKKCLFIFLTTILLFSCSQNLPELNSATGYMVYDFENETDLPEVRLGVFLDVASDVHRADKIRVECTQNNFIWECLTPVKIETGKKKYSGYSNFVMPENKTFPAGKYLVWYTDSNGNEESTVINVSITEGASAFTVSQAVEFMTQNNGKESIAVSDVNSVLLFYGEKKDIRNIDDIWNRYPSGESYRIVWTRNNGKEIFILPVVLKNPVQESEAEENNSEEKFTAENNSAEENSEAQNNEKNGKNEIEEEKADAEKESTEQPADYSSSNEGAQSQMSGERNDNVRRSESE